MASKKALIWVLKVVILTWTVSLPFAQSSCSTVRYGTNMVGNRVTEAAPEVERFGKDSSLTVEVSSRQVPTGPDPLHNNNNPISP